MFGTKHDFATWIGATTKSSGTKWISDQLESLSRQLQCPIVDITGVQCLVSSCCVWWWQSRMIYGLSNPIKGNRCSKINPVLFTWSRSNWECTKLWSLNTFLWALLVILATNRCYPFINPNCKLGLLIINWNKWELLCQVRFYGEINWWKWYMLHSKYTWNAFRYRLHL